MNLRCLLQPEVLLIAAIYLAAIILGGVRLAGWVRARRRRRDRRG